jgi:putative Holliday junction resolvase
MRYLGIDYGEKRVGIAVSDADGKFAFAKAVFPNNNKLIESVQKMCAEQKIGAIVVGESNDLNIMPNEIMKQIEPFKNNLERMIGLPVYFEPEFYSSAEAERIQGKVKNLDASAAAIILQSYLDKIPNNK